MEVLLVLAGLWILIILIGTPIFWLTNSGRITQQQRAIDALKAQLRALETSALPVKPQDEVVDVPRAQLTEENIVQTPAPVSSACADLPVPVLSLAVEPEPLSDQLSLLPSIPELSDVDTAAVAPLPDPSPVIQDAQEKSAKNAVDSLTPAVSAASLEGFLAKNGLLWLGGIVLAFGGAFLAKFSIDSGLLSISARLSIGGVFSLLLLVAAEYLYRHSARFGIRTPAVSAALAGGGIITAFSLVLVAFAYYQLLSPTLAMLILAAIALLAIVIALRFGPLLAVIGISGAYAVPVLVLDQITSDILLILYFYVGFVSFAGVWVAQQLEKAYLWYQSAAGHFFWLLGTLTSVNVHQAWLYFAFVNYSAYLYGFSRVMGIGLQRTQIRQLHWKTLFALWQERVAIILSYFAWMLFFMKHGFQDSMVTQSAVLLSLLGLVAWRHSVFDPLLFIGLIFVLLTLGLWPETHLIGADITVAFHGRYLYAQLVALAFFAYAVWMHNRWPQRWLFSLLLLVAPLSSYAFTYSLTTAVVATAILPVWSLGLVFLAATALWLSYRDDTPHYQLAGWVLAQLSLAYVLLINFEADTLTLALGLQLVVLCYGQRFYRITLPRWLPKLVLSAILLRVSLAPWMEDYAQGEILSVHWSGIILPLVGVLIWLAQRCNSDVSLRRWLQGGLLQLCALFITTESGYYLVGHYPHFTHLSFEESALLSFNWLLLGLVYWWRACWVGVGASAVLATIAGAVLLFGSSMLQLKLSFSHNPFLTQQWIGEHFFFNWLLLIWLLPAGLLLAVLRWQLLPAGQYRLLGERVCMILAGMFACLFINGTIRSFFQGESIWLGLATSQAELYSYSMVWLLVAVSFVIFGRQRDNPQIYRLGFALLSLVLLKAFVLDMANLSGLYRALSFIALGLSLVGLGWLFQKLAVSSAGSVSPQDSTAAAPPGTPLESEPNIT